MLVRNHAGVDLSLFPMGLDVHPGESQKVDAKGTAALLRKLVVEGAVELHIEPSENTLWKDGKGIHVLWMSPLSPHNGYGNAAVTLAKALSIHGVNLYGFLSWFEFDSQPTSDWFDQRLMDNVADDLRVGVVLAQPGHFRLLPTPYRIGYTMYESSDPLAVHPEWKYECQVIDRLWVPTEYCRSVFGQFVNVPIDVVPFPVDTTFCTGGRRKRKEKNSFTFGMHGYLTARKSPIETIQAFKKAFPKPDYPNVYLELKTWRGMCGYGVDQIPVVDDERIIIYDEVWSRDELLTWLLSLDAYVFPSKGEGFGLPPREALATGLPTIVPRSGGLLDIADNTYTFPLPCGKPEPSPLGGEWEVPDWDALVETMRNVYNNYDEALKVARAGAKFIQRYGTYEPVGKVAYDALDNLTPTLSSPSRSENDDIEKGFVEEVLRVAPLGSKILVLGSQKLKEALSSFYQCDFVENPFTIYRMVGGRRKYTACVSWGWMQTLYDLEADKFAQYQLRLASVVVAGVPSVRMRRLYTRDSRHLRPAAWQDVLRRYVVTVRPLKDFDALVVQSPEDVPSVVYRRH